MLVMVVMFMVMVMLVLMLVLMLMMVLVLMTAARMSMFVVMMMFVCHNYFNFSILQSLNFSISQFLNLSIPLQRYGVVFATRLQSAVQKTFLKYLAHSEIISTFVPVFFIYG